MRLEINYKIHVTNVVLRATDSISKINSLEISGKLTSVYFLVSEKKTIGSTNKISVVQI